MPAEDDTALALLMHHLAKVKLEKEEEAFALSTQIQAVNRSLQDSVARQQELEDELVRASVRARGVDPPHQLLVPGNGGLFVVIETHTLKHTSRHSLRLSPVRHPNTTRRSCAWGRSTS